MNKYNNTFFIDTRKDFKDLCEDILSSCSLKQQVIGVDTEFWRQKTYWPQLCLVQIFWKNKAYLVDAMAFDLSRIKPLLEEKRLQKIMHAAQQDCEIFWKNFGIFPHSLFDTQLAAKLLGFQRQIGYATLVEEIMGISVDKTHQFTDWRNRPLSKEQIAYAAQDVAYLVKLYTHLKKMLQTHNLLEECQGLHERMYEHVQLLYDPDRVWTRWDNPRYNAKQRARLRFLAEYREKLAQKLDVPRAKIFSNAAMVDFIIRPPKTPQRIKFIKGIGPLFPNIEDFWREFLPLL